MSGGEPSSIKHSSGCDTVSLPLTYSHGSGSIFFEGRDWMYQVLYRKYRPQTFDDVVGQDHVTRTLKNEIKSGRINHAYLFTGSRGTGKTTCAKILAKAVNCTDLKDSNPCNSCEICRGIDSGEILDVVEMDAASNRKIDNIRDIIDEVAFTPAKAKYRVYIIDEVHMLTNEAFNALLKTLEEPPKHVIFILATTEVHKLPATIVSRTQRFDFKRISPEEISKRLLDIAEKEDVSLTDEAALLISALADGALRDAISILDRCIGISSDVNVEVVRNAAGLASKGHLFQMCNCMINKNAAKALEIIDDLYQNSKDMSKLTDELISHFRTLMLIKTVKNARQMVALSDREYEAALAQTDYLTLADIVYYMDVLQRAYERMGKGVSNRIELETAVVKLTSADLESTNEALVVRISSLEKAVKKMQAGAYEFHPQNQQNNKKTDVLPEEPDFDDEPVKDSVPAEIKEDHKEEIKEEIKEEPEDCPDPVQEAADEPVSEIVDIPEETVPLPEPDFSVTEKAVTEKAQDSAVPESTPTQRKSPEEKRQDANRKIEELSEKAEPFLQWPEVVENMKSYSSIIAASFKDCDAYVAGGFLLIDTKSDIPFRLLEKKEMRDSIRNAVSEVTGVRYKLGPYRLRSNNKEKKKDEILDDFIAKLRDNGVSVSEVDYES